LKWTEPDDDFATYVRTARQAAGLSQREMAERMQVDTRSVQRWEAGEVGAYPCMQYLIRYWIEHGGLDD